MVFSSGNDTKETVFSFFDKTASIFEGVLKEDICSISLSDTLTKTFKSQKADNLSFTCSSTMYITSIGKYMFFKNSVTDFSPSAVNFPYFCLNFCCPSDLTNLICVLLITFTFLRFLESIKKSLNG